MENTIVDKTPSHGEELEKASQNGPDEAVFVSETGEKLLLDKHGLPLVPQPTSDPADPLNWSTSVKAGILLFVSFAAANSIWNTAVANPAFTVIAKAFDIEVTEASYSSTAVIAAIGVGCFLWLPLALVYGRRPMYIICLLGATVFTIWSAVAPTFTQLVVSRAISGIFLAGPPVLGLGVCADLFFVHNRGRAVGIFTVFLSNGAHLAPLPGGFLAQYVGWRWAFGLPAITTGILLLVALVAYPETLFLRDRAYTPSTAAHPIRNRITFIPRAMEGRRLEAAAFFRPWTMLRYPTFVLAMLYYAMVFCIGSVLPALTVSKAFAQVYHFKAAKTGMCLFVATFFGGVLGELMAGPVIDRQMRYYREKHAGKVNAEQRLLGVIPSVPILVAGLLIFGLIIEKKGSYVAVCFGMALTCFAVQVVVTPTYAYVADAFKPQASECALMINFFRQEFSMTIPFWSPPLVARIGFDKSYGIYCCVIVAFFLPLIWVIRYGEANRKKIGQPTFNRGV